MKKPINLITLLMLGLFTTAQNFPVTFDNLPLPKGQQVWKGQDYSQAIISNDFSFFNSYDSTWDYWTGFAYSAIADDSTPGFANQFASYAGGGINGTTQYAVGTEQAKIIPANPRIIKGMYITNSTYAALSMQEGDAFAKKFGGASGNDADYFILKVYGMQLGKVKDSAHLYLADYTFADNNKDYILKDWRWLDLTHFGIVDSIWFDFESSDTGKFGINTPKYFCVDDLNGTAPSAYALEADFEAFNLDSTGVWNGSALTGGFEMANMFFENQYNPDWDVWRGWSVSNQQDTTTAGFGNQYSVISGSGYNTSKNYLVGYEEASIRLPYNEGMAITQGQVGIMINNSTYTYLAMKNGDAFSKKFGGVSGNDPDYLKLIIHGYNKQGNWVDSVIFYLADFRFANNADDYIVNQWTQVDLSNLVLNGAIRLDFSLASSDNGTFGMNTPAFFCADNVLNISNSGAVGQHVFKLDVYPNPATERIQMGLLGFKNVQVFDLKGNKVLEEETTSDTLQIDALHKGFYILQVSQGDKIYRTKFVKQ